MFIHENISLGYDDIEAVTLPEGRVYHCPNGKKYPSITTVLGFRPNPHLAAWKERVGPIEAARVSRQACVRGEHLHSICERHLNNHPPQKLLPHLKELYLKVRPVLDSRVGRVFLQEKPLYSSKLGVAGRVDLIAEFDGVLSVVDFKTSSREKSRNDIHSYFMQETFYACAFRELTSIRVPQLVTVMLCDELPTPKIFIEKPEDWINPLIEEVRYYRAAQQ